MTSQYFSGGISGGAATDGYRMLEKYHEGELSREKAQLIKNIAQDLKSTLKFKADIENLSTDDLIDTIRKALPNPRTQMVEKKGSQQQATCLALANSINHRYGKTMIDTSKSAGEICEKVSEVMNTLFAGLHGEFTSIAGDAKRVLKNMQILRNSLQSGFEKLFEVTNESGTDVANMQSMPIYHVFKSELNELDRQIAMLSNMVDGVLTPTTRTIAELTEEDKDFSGFVKKLQGDLGSDNMSRKITYVLANINDVAMLAQQIDNALKKIGHSISEYKKYKTTSELLKYLHDAFEKEHKKPSSEDLAKFVAVVQLIENNDYAHDDIIKHLEGKSKTATLPKKKGGADDSSQSLSKRMERQRKVRDILFRDLERKLDNQYKQIAASVSVLAKRFGTQIKMDDNLNKFVQTMKDLSRDDIEREKFYLALSGYAQDPYSREERQRFLGHLGAVSNSLKPLISGSSGSEKAHFESIKNSVDELIRTIDTFKDTYLTPLTTIKFKKGGNHEEDKSGQYGDEYAGLFDWSNGYSSKTGRGTDEKESKSDDSVPAEDDMSFVDEVESVTGGRKKKKTVRGAGETLLSLTKAIHDLAFFYDVARMKHNLAIASQDIKTFKQGYSEVVAQAIGQQRDLINKEYQQNLLEYSDKTKEGAKLVESWIKQDPKKTESRKATFESVKKYWNEQRTVKIDFLKTVEAIDMYLSNFADAVATNPEVLKDVSQLLKSVDIVGEWFTNDSGNSIAALLESTPSALNGATEVNPSDRYEKNHSGHYYKWVEKIVKNAKPLLPANPFSGTFEETTDDESVYDKLLLKADRASKSVHVLSNIMSMFQQFGSGAAGASFMTPPMILTKLRQYMFHSSLVVGMKDLAKDSVDLDYTRDSTVDSASNTKIKKGVNMQAGTSFDLTHSDPEQSADLDRRIRSRFAMAFTSIYKYDKTGKYDGQISGFNDSWYNTDKLFVMAIKGIVAKVFTVIGTYGIFNKPLDKYKGLSTTRFILGGDSSIPEVKSEVTELYIRLPLLAEFYRDTLDFENKDTVQIGDKHKKIAIIPDLDGIWENFIKIVFVDAKFIKEGSYSENHVKSLIREINNIYNKYKSDSSTVSDVISAFVAEINRRYGVVIQTDVEKYLKEKRRYDINTSYSHEDRTDYNLLGERDVHSVGPAPSDKFDVPLSSTLVERKFENPWDFKYVELVNGFRDRVDQKIKMLMPKNDKMPRVSFTSTVQVYKNQIEAAKTNDEKFQIILKAMQGTDQLSSVSTQKAVMFHETVVAPLGTLYSTWTVLKEFIDRIRELDVISMEKIIEDGINDTATATKDYDYFKNLLDTKNAHVKFGKYLNKGYSPNYKHSGVNLPTMERAPENKLTANILIYRGTYGARCNVSWADATNMLRNMPKDKDDVIEGMKRFLIDREAIFSDLVSLTFALGGDLNETVSAKVQGHSLVVEYSGLLEHCQTVLESVKKSIETFRGVIDDDIIRRMEGGASEGTAPDDGSLYFIDEHLMEELLKDTRQDLSKSFEGGIGINMTNEIIGRTFRRLCTPWTVLGAVSKVGTEYTFDKPISKDSPNEAEAALIKHQQSLLLDSFEHPMAEILYWNPSASIRTDATGVGVYEHPLNRDNVVNKSINDWPYAVIPSIEHGESEGVKEIKTIQESMLALQNEMQKLFESVRPVIANSEEIFQYPISLIRPTGWPAVTGNYGLMVETETDANKDPVNAKINELPSPELKARVLELGNRYNTLYKQRERIFQSNIHAPIGQRAKWYLDPSDPTYGTWFLNQLTADEIGDKKLRFDSGLLVRFNEILAKYLYMGWDVTSRNMYKGLIDKFASGTHVAATMKNEALNDIQLPYALWSKTSNVPGFIGVPASHVTIFSSLARAMRNIMTNTNRAGDPAFRIDTMTELPLHMKETLRATLPSFDKLFKLVIKKAEFLRHIASQVSLVRQLPYELKYGVNRTVATAITARSLYYGSSPDMTDTNNTLLSLPPEYNPFGNVQNNINTPNQALIETNDAIHLATGFVIRNMSSKLKGEVASDKTKAWVVGHNSDIHYKDGTRYSDKWASQTSWAHEDSTAYVAFAPYEELTAEMGRRWHIELIDSIILTSTSIDKCANEVYKELADEPKYLETHEGFISDYTALNKQSPIMLLSQLQISLRPRFREDEGSKEWDLKHKTGYAKPNYLLPLYRSGESPFKLNYGSRLVLGRDVKPGFEYMPGVASLLERYNGVSQSDSRFDKTAFETSTLAHIQLLRYLVDLRFFRSVLDHEHGGRGGYKAGSALFDTSITKYNKEQRSYTMQCSLEEVLAITESSDQEDITKSLIGSLHSKVPQTDSRGNARIYNIIDLNITPINVHSLMRDVPLVTLINYSYTFDRIVQDKLLPDLSRKNVIDSTHAVTSSRSMLAKLLIHPYAKVDSTEFYGYIARIMTGDSDIAIGRPKFISDQLWNKTLLQELYTQPKLDETGPASDNAQRRALMVYRDNADKLLGIAKSMETALNVRATFANVVDLDTAKAAINIIIVNMPMRQLFSGITFNTKLADSVTLKNALVALAPLINNAPAVLNANLLLDLAPKYRNVFNNLLARLNTGDATLYGQDLVKDIALATFLYALLEEQLMLDAKETNTFNNNGTLQFPEKADDATTIGVVSFGEDAINIRNDLGNLGRMRFDVKFIRDLTWLTNIQRFVRLMLRDEMQSLEQAVVSSNDVVSRQITDYIGNEQFDRSTFRQ